MEKKEIKEETKKQGRRMRGIVVSDRMKKTRVVEVERVWRHPRYKKRLRVHKRYKVHDEKEQYHMGDKVVIQETRPLSKEKRWTIRGFIQN